MYGKVKRIVKDRGFGFIAGDDGTEYFFHMSAIQKEPGWNFDNLKEGEEVEFDDTDSDKGRRAENISRA